MDVDIIDISSDKPKIVEIKLNFTNFSAEKKIIPFPTVWGKL